MSAFQLVSGIFYITTYENVRHFLQQRGVKDSRVRALAGGACASLVGQTIIVPFDVISQHMMVLGQAEGHGKSRIVVNPLKIDYHGRKKPQVLFFIYVYLGFIAFSALIFFPESSVPINLQHNLYTCIILWYNFSDCIGHCSECLQVGWYQRVLQRVLGLYMCLRAKLSSVVVILPFLSR